ncbi:MAG: bifunctional phosphopantothenoylcysteine decarboxylase/phosphopantothenate--cysteine ligase CoaBC [Bacteriovoracaceae bacterium]|nr:bifunctional phosphopantothenoylcysteine decarboxylase/phosphopantothenate--cysteine ligase CoaBC [Bacteriovoracaceae bacterium]
MNIILGVTGSVAAYKSYDLLRLWAKDGHDVHVILTKGSLRFINPHSYHYLGAKGVWSSEDDFSPAKNQKFFTAPVSHIELSKWCDLLVIAPLGANTMAKISMGRCDDLLTSVYLALPPHKRVLLAPAMNTEMWNKQQTKDHWHKLTHRPNHFIASPERGLLACHDEGEGKLANIETIFHLSLALPQSSAPQKKWKVLITAGATISPLDPIRYLTNPSTGELGYIMAETFLNHGHQVVCVVGPYSKSKFNDLKDHPSFTLKQIFTAEEMFEETKQYFESQDIFISTAAVNDIKFPPSLKKLKKDQIQNQLQVDSNPDILGQLLLKRKKSQIIIGFAAETELTIEVVKEKILRKPVDLLLVNKSQGPWMKTGGEQGFNESTLGFYAFFPHSASPFDKKNLDQTWAKTKNECAKKILEWCQTNAPIASIAPITPTHRD